MTIRWSLRTRRVNENFNENVSVKKKHEDRDKNAGKENLSETRSLGPDLERGEFITASMIITWTTPEWGGGNVDAGGNQNNPEVTAQTFPTVIERKTYSAPTDFDNAVLKNHAGFFARAPWFDIILLETADFCKRYTTEGYLQCGGLLTALASVAWCSYDSCADSFQVLGWYLYRTRGEMELVRNLTDVTEKQLAVAHSWRPLTRRVGWRIRIGVAATSCRESAVTVSASPKSRPS